MKKSLTGRATVWLFTGLLIASYVDSTRRADNTTGVSYRTVTIEDVDIFYREDGQETSDPTQDFLIRKVPTNPIAAR